MDISVILEYGKSAEKVNKIVPQKIKEMTGMDIRNLNLTIQDVMKKEEFNQMQNNHIQ